MSTSIEPRTPDYVTLHFGGDHKPPAITVIKVAQVHASGVIWGDVQRLEGRPIQIRDDKRPRGIRVLSAAAGCYIDEEGQIVCYPS